MLTLITGEQYTVKYWIPFDAPLFGFHDSSWQKFPYGSPKYRTHGVARLRPHAAEGDRVPVPLGRHRHAGPHPRHDPASLDRRVEGHAGTTRRASSVPGVRIGPSDGER